MGASAEIRRIEPRACLGNEEGQSLLEFLLVLPLLIGTVVILVRVNTAVQMSIVNQQYARSHALFIAHNSPVYPRWRHHEKFFLNGTNQVVMGVSENNLRSDDEDGAEYFPEASTQLVSRNRRLAGTDVSGGEIPDRRGKVRIRNTVSLCAPSIVMRGNGGSLLPVGPDMPEVADATSFLYCASRLEGMETLKP